MPTSGWAIKYTYTDIDGTAYTGFLGKHYFGRTTPDCLDGYRTVVFRTRQLAREAARWAGRGYDRATAVRVNVIVAEVV